ncbi:MAG: energy-coupling factor transporter transmembrane protein EcfT [Treponema sp.]|nr:energy-coupling factor transporter transmembrane protein EcfT [Treponema sp.]
MAVNLFLYRNGNSFFHKLPAFIKLILMFTFCSFVFTEKKFILKVCILLCAISFILAKCRFNTIKNLRFLLYISVFIIVVKSIEFSSSGFSFNKCGMIEGVLYCSRFALISFFAEIIFETTSSLEIRICLEQIENAFSLIIPPLKKIRLSLIISLAITFIPQVFEKWNQVHLAVKSRCPKKRKLHQSVSILMTELTALISCLLRAAETKRLSILNRTYNSLNDTKK